MKPAPTAVKPAAQANGTPSASPPQQPGNLLHGVTLETMVTGLAAHYGWQDLGERIAIRCFTHEPSVASSMKFLRRTPWAREKIESLYLFMQREIRRAQPQKHNFPPAKAAEGSKQIHTSPVNSPRAG